MSMSRFERMIALPEDEYQELKSIKNATNPIENKFQSLSHDYQKQDHIPDPYIKLGHL